jgi:DNA-binding NtrC family response regulator
MQPRLDVLVVDDEPALREVLALRLADWGHDARAVASAGDAERAIATSIPDLVLCDVVLPGSSGLGLLIRLREQQATLPFVMMTAHGNIDSAVEAMKSGATDFLTKPIDYATLRALVNGVVRDVVARQQARSLNDELRRLDGSPLVGRSRAMRELRRTIAVLAATDASAIITGESGTGKEVVARALHAASARGAKPFVAINAAAIPEGLIESEVFGHEQGAFTGAVRARAGCFENAEGGTLFLDEIAEMPIALQPKLLRVLEDGRVRRLGSARDVRFDVRLLAATNRDAARAIRDGRLREDLYYRLNVFELVIPPLRERGDDIPLLAQHFVRECSRRHRMPVEGIAEDAAVQLAAHDWPGNVRELRNVVERAVIVAGRGWIERRHLPPYLQSLSGGVEPTLTLPAGTSMADAERTIILHTLARVNDNKAEAARQLGVDVKTIRNKLRGYGRGRSA